MVSAFRGVIGPAADEETIAVVKPEPTTDLNDAPPSLTGGPLGGAWCLSCAFIAMQTFVRRGLH